MSIEFTDRPPFPIERTVITTVDRRRKGFSPEWFADIQLDTFYGLANLDPSRPEDYPVPWWAVKSNFPVDDIPFTARDLVMNNPFRFIGDLDPSKYLAKILLEIRPNKDVIGALLGLCKKKYLNKIDLFMVYPPIDGVKDRFGQYYIDVKKVLTSYL